MRKPDATDLYNLAKREERESRAEMCRRNGVQYWSTQQCMDTEDESEEDEEGIASQASGHQAARPPGPPMGASEGGPTGPSVFEHGSGVSRAPT